MFLASIQCCSGPTKSPGGRGRPSRAGRTILEQQGAIGSGRAGPANDCLKVENDGISLLGVRDGPAHAAGVGSRMLLRTFQELNFEYLLKAS